MALPGSVNGDGTNGSFDRNFFLWGEYITWLFPQITCNRDTNFLQGPHPGNRCIGMHAPLEVCFFNTRATIQ